MKNYFFLMVVCIVLGSCSTGDVSIARMLGGSSQALVFLSCKAISEDELKFEFSKAVTVKNISFSPELPVASVENGSAVIVKLAKNTEPGAPFTVDILAEDEKRNSINVIDSFRSRNNRMPKLQINELCTEASKEKTEFIELKMKSGGNLGAMRVVILGNSTASKRTVYEFMPIEVRKDDYVVIHLRTVEESCVDEYNGSIGASGSKNSSPSAWDFYMPGNTKLMQKAATTVYVLDQDDNVLDAVMISDKTDSSWAKDYHTEAAEFLFNQDAWKSADGNICFPAGAISSAGTTNTRTICRDETAADTNTAADWYITATSSATPGKINSNKRYSN